MTVSLCLKFYCCPVLPFWSIARALFCCCFFFILTVGLETNYLRMHWTQLRQICRVGKHSGEDNQSLKFPRDFSRDAVMVTDFLTFRRKSTYPTNSFSVLPIVYDGWEDHNADGCIGDGSSTTWRTLVQ